MGGPGECGPSRVCSNGEGGAALGAAEGGAAGRGGAASGDCEYKGTDGDGGSTSGVRGGERCRCLLGGDGGGGGGRNGLADGRWGLVDIEAERGELRGDIDGVGGAGGGDRETLQKGGGALGEGEGGGGFVQSGVNGGEDRAIGADLWGCGKGLRAV